MRTHKAGRTWRVSTTLEFHNTLENWREEIPREKDAAFRVVRRARVRLRVSHTAAACAIASASAIQRAPRTSRASCARPRRRGGPNSSRRADWSGRATARAEPRPTYIQRDAFEGDAQPRTANPHVSFSPRNNGESFVDAATICSKSRPRSAVCEQPEPTSSASQEGSLVQRFARTASPEPEHVSCLCVSH